MQRRRRRRRGHSRAHGGLDREASPSGPGLLDPHGRKNLPGRVRRLRSGKLAGNQKGESLMSKSLQGTKTHTNLKEAFAGESQANRRYLYFAKVADVEGFPEIAGNFKETADGETGHAHGHLDYLKQVGDPATGLPIGNTEKNLKAAVAGETYEYETMYPGMAKTARDEGFDDVAEWFETLAKAEKSHAGRFAKMLDVLKN